MPHTLINFNSTLTPYLYYAPKAPTHKSSSTNRHPAYALSVGSELVFYAQEGHLSGQRFSRCHYQGPGFGKAAPQATIGCGR